jgi:hypothetical protein
MSACGLHTLRPKRRRGLPPAIITHQKLKSTAFIAFSRIFARGFIIKPQSEQYTDKFDHHETVLY